MIFIDTYIRVVDEISNLLFYPLISFIYNLSSLDYIINILIYYIFYRLLNETPISILRFFKFLYLEILVNLSEVFLTLVPRVRRQGVCLSSLAMKIYQRRFGLEICCLGEMRGTSMGFDFYSWFMRAKLNFDHESQLFNFVSSSFLG